MIELPMRIRWRDVDSYGHVNNAVYLTYLEEARDRWVEETLPGTNFVIVRIAIDYRRELALADEEVTVTCRGIGYGTSSIRTAGTGHREGGMGGRRIGVDRRRARRGPAGHGLSRPTSGLGSMRRSKRTASREGRGGPT